MKVAWYCDQYPGAYQEYVRNLHVNLRQAHGLDVAIVTHDLTRKNLERRDRIAVMRPGGIREEIIKRLSHRPLNRVERWLQQFDIVHVQQSFLYPFIAGLSKARHAPSVVITFRGGDTYVKPWTSARWREQHRDVRDSVAAVQVMSAHQREYLQKWDYASDKIHVIPISTSTRASGIVACKIDGPIRLCSVFRMTWEKNIEANLRVVRALRRRGVAVTYNVYGDGPDLGQMYFLRDRFGLSESVVIHGRIDPDQLAGELASNHVLLQLSTSDALPASVIEAMSLGIPCVVSSVGGLPEIVQTGVNGYVMDFEGYDLEAAASVIEHMASSDELYQNLKRGAFATFQERFSPSIEAANVFNMYRSVLSRRIG